MKTIAFIFWLVAWVGCAEPFVVNSAGQRISGSAIVADADGTIRLTTHNGQTLTFAKGAYRQALADKPPEFAQIAALLKAKDLEGVAELLGRVQKSYRYLGWDQRAGLMLARIYLPLKRFEESVREYDAYFSVKPQAKRDLKERANYMQALLGAGRISTVEAMIQQDIASGSREAAARAQIVRGDMKAAAGQYEEALLDYFRTSILFKAQTAVQPEALYKTAEALEQLQDARAETYFQQVLKEYSTSEFAAKVREDGQ